jgi:murein L,D-transpeptidase YafK
VKNKTALLLIVFIMACLTRSFSTNAQGPGQQLYIRIFKQEKELQLWIKNSKENSFSLYKTFKVCALSGNLGPKRKEGDLQVPEGIYSISTIDVNHKYYKGLYLNYPNESDLILSDKTNPGSEIAIHGNCFSTGCVAMSDEVMDQIFPLAEKAIFDGQSNIPVHIFPCDFSKTNLTKLLESDPEFGLLKNGWTVMAEAQQHFDQWKTLPWIIVEENGNYSLIK